MERRLKRYLLFVTVLAIMSWCQSCFLFGSLPTWKLFEEVHEGFPAIGTGWPLVTGGEDSCPSPSSPWIHRFKCAEAAEWRIFCGHSCPSSLEKWIYSFLIHAFVHLYYKHLLSAWELNVKCADERTKIQEWRQMRLHSQLGSSLQLSAGDGRVTKGSNINPSLLLEPCLK